MYCCSELSQTVFPNHRTLSEHHQTAVQLFLTLSVHKYFQLAATIQGRTLGSTMWAKLIGLFALCMDLHMGRDGRNLLSSVSKSRPIKTADRSCFLTHLAPSFPGLFVKDSITLSAENESAHLSKTEQLRHCYNSWDARFSKIHIQNRVFVNEIPGHMANLCFSSNSYSPATVTVIKHIVV